VVLIYRVVLARYLALGQFGGETLFYQAVKGGHLTAARLLLTAGADINFQAPPRQETALNYLMRYNKAIPAKQLISWGARADIYSFESPSSLDFAIIYNHPDLLAAMLNSPAQPDLRKDSSLANSTLYYCLSTPHCSLKILKLLLSYGAEVTATDQTGETLLHQGERIILVDTGEGCGAFPGRLGRTGENSVPGALGVNDMNYPPAFRRQRFPDKTPVAFPGQLFPAHDCRGNLLRPAHQLFQPELESLRLPVGLIAPRAITSQAFSQPGIAEAHRRQMSGEIGFAEMFEAAGGIVAHINHLLNTIGFEQSDELLNSESARAD
jgi:hypothetical protein